MLHAKPTLTLLHARLPSSYVLKGILAGNTGRGGPLFKIGIVGLMGDYMINLR